MKHVAVLGGGPAGAFAAERLARAGLRTTVFDEKLAWEKPCGGGITFKAYQQYPFLLDNETPKKIVRETELASQSNSARLTLNQPLVIYSRRELNQLLLDRAAAAGAALEKTRIQRIERANGGWRLRTRTGDVEADYCVIATGARNSLREVGTEWSASDTMVALGYYVPADQAHIDIQFFSNFEGYVWVFPRHGHLSVGICGKGEPAHRLRQRLERYMEERSLPRKDAQFYGHVLPSLENRAWPHNRVAGDGWMAVGDAAGLVDPITGEGLYYAIRSADLATSVMLGEVSVPNQQPQLYRSLLEREFTDDLAFAARIAKRLFLGQLLQSSVPARMIQLMRRSPIFCDLIQDLFAGTQSYADLKCRLMQNLNGTVHEVLAHLFLRKLVPSANRP